MIKKYTQEQLRNMSAQELNELVENRSDLNDKIQALLDKKVEEDRSFTTEEENEVREFQKQFDELTKVVDQVEEYRKLDKQKIIAEHRSGELDIHVGEKRMSEKTKNEAHERAFKAWAEGSNPEKLDEEARQLFDESRAQTVVDSEGGFTVPESISNKAVKALKDFGGVRSVSDVIKTSTGEDMTLPGFNDTSNKGEILGSGVEPTEQDIAFTGPKIGSHTYSSKVLYVDSKLLRDSAYNIEQMITPALIERIARIENEHFTTGDGNGKPQGLLPAVSQGLETAVSGTLTDEELVTFMMSVNSAYRKNAYWMLNDNTLTWLYNQKDSEGRRLWQPSMTSGTPDLIFGKPYVVNDDLPDIGAGNTPILFGDFKNYKIRDSGSLIAVREPVPLKRRIAFTFFKDTDARYQDAGGGAVKKLLIKA